MVLGQGGDEEGGQGLSYQQHSNGHPSRPLHLHLVCWGYLCKLLEGSVGEEGAGGHALVQQDSREVAQALQCVQLLRAAPPCQTHPLKLKEANRL